MNEKNKQLTRNMLAFLNKRRQQDTAKTIKEFSAFCGITEAEAKNTITFFETFKII